MIMELIALWDNTPVSFHQLEQTMQKTEAHRKQGGYCFTFRFPIVLKFSESMTEFVVWFILNVHDHKEGINC